MSLSKETKTILEGEPIQILKYDDKKKLFEINTQLEQILLNNNEIEDCPIAVISIAGALRMGKSFLLNIFLRYLQAEYVNNDSNDWLDNNEALKGFEWRGGCDKYTTGIWIWSKVFIKNLPNNKKIGVLLMDTQGMHDEHSSLNINATIFSLSALLSSVLIYNLMQNIKEDDLQYLQLFTDYSKHALETSKEKPFQKLLFLVRDWEHINDFPFGAEGGLNFLKKKLQVISVHQDELTCVRNYLKNSYDELDGFLLPHPGKIATRSKDFIGQLKDCDEEFLDGIKELVPLILHPENVFEKKIFGSKITIQHFLQNFNLYANKLKKGEAISSQTIYEAVIETNNFSAMSKALEYYENEMIRDVLKNKEHMDMENILKLHESIAAEAINQFTKNAKMGQEEQRAKYSSQLSKDMESLLSFYMTHNESKIIRIKDSEVSISKNDDAENIINKTIEKLLSRTNLKKEHQQIIKTVVQTLKKMLESDDMKKFLKFLLKLAAIGLITAGIAIAIPYLLALLPASIPASMWAMLETPEAILVIRAMIVAATPAIAMSQ